MAANTLVYTNCHGIHCNVWAEDLTARQPFPLAESDWDEAQPSTDGVRVVWRDGRNVTGSNGENRLNNFDIYGSLLEEKKPFNITKAPRMQNRPAVWGNTVVWSDFRGAQSEGDPQSGRIVMYNIASGQETPISGAHGAQVRPVTNGRVVVWVDYRNEPDPNGKNSDIYAYDLVTGQEFPITNAPDTQTDPAISGNIVVWTDWRKGDNSSDIYAYDLSTHKEFPITTAPGSQIQPSISGNLIVWADFRNEPDKSGTDSDIYGYDLATHAEFPIFTGPGVQNSPVVSGNSVAWVDNSRGFDNLDILGSTITGITLQAAEPAPPVLPGKGSQPFRQTGQEVSGLFLDYWQRNGGLAQQGYPISGVMREASDVDGKIYTVQYFERGVFEYHPENPAPFNVLLSQLGTFRFKKMYPSPPSGEQPSTSPDAILFPQTNKHLGGKFLQYWQQHGGLAQQGYPISEEFTEVSDLDNKPYTVQYFERAVFELHTENQPPYDVLLSQLGTFRLKEKHPLRP
ncbi:MAG: hypothetical protein M3014_13950 [Chloroflexota bacterium]|nr:hypothetical protein [Chloroflexota bacterium]